MKKFKISELADILGISYVAVKKKIKPDENNPDIIRYKNRYTVINETVKGRDVAFILLDDADLENEIKESNVNKTVYSTKGNVIKTDNKTVEYIDVEPEKQNIKNDNLLEFTERYINRFETLYKELNEKDKRLVLLEDFENRAKTDNIEKAAKIKELEAKLNKKEKGKTLIIGLLTTLLIVFITLSVTFIYLYANLTKRDQVRDQVTVQVGTKKEQVQTAPAHNIKK